MRPGSFSIKILTEETNCYSIRLVPVGYQDSGHGNPHTSCVYRIYIVKGTINSEGNVEEERALRIGKGFRFRLEHIGALEREWTEPGSSRSEALYFYCVCSSYNYRVVETKTGKIMYTLNTLLSVADAVRANIVALPVTS